MSNTVYDKAKKLTDDNDEDGCNFKFIEGYLAGHAEGLNTRRWISIDESMPPRNKHMKNDSIDVLIYIKYDQSDRSDQSGHISIGWFDYNTGKCKNLRYSNIYVTHWQYLPDNPD